MTDDDVLNGLASRLPSDRMTAAVWLVQNGVSDETRPAVQAAASREGVPRIRAALSAALRSFSAASQSTLQDNPEQGDRDASILADLASMIRHEMQPAIGWIRYAAHGDIPNFDQSATNRAIEGLRQRVDGLVQLTDAHRAPIRRQASLLELLQFSAPKDDTAQLFAFEAPEDVDDSIVTDSGLFMLLLSNAMQNAVDAVTSSSEPGIVVTVGVTPSHFWVAIINRQPGANWQFVDVAPTGVSTKANKRGLGTRVMELAASRLGYDIDLQANGGTVTFTVRGPRNV